MITQIVRGGIYMATLSATFYSQTLNTTTHAEVIFPNPPFQAPPTRVLYLLHGMKGACKDWLHQTPIFRYADLHNYIVIMPEVHNSFYTDMVYGYDYFTYVAHELPKTVEYLFNVRHKREETFVAGLSMGGYGALKIALSRPEFFAGCAGFSGALDAERAAEMFNSTDEWHKKLARSIMGEGLQVPENNNYLPLPPIWQIILKNQKSSLPAAPRIFYCRTTVNLTHL